MNREQFEERKGEDLDAIQNVYFDCNALDRMTETESVAPVQDSSDPNEELKMDKDLGLFEMINAGDFATVTNNSAAAASVQAVTGGAQADTFNFDSLMSHPSGNEGQASNESAPDKSVGGGQSADDFFNFGSSPA